MIIPPPPSSSIASSTCVNNVPPPPPPLSTSNNLLNQTHPIKKMRIPNASKNKEEDCGHDIEEKTDTLKIVVDPTLIVKDHYIPQPVPLDQQVGGNYRDLKILLIMSYSRPNQSANTLNESIEKSILESGRCPEIVLTPESWLSTPLKSTPDKKIVMNKELDDMCQVMKRHKCYGFIGVKVWAVDENFKPLNNYYNSLIVINPDGEVLGCYRKRVPTSAEKSTPGDTVGVFDTIYGRIAVLICFDIENQIILDEVLAYKPFLILNPTHIGGGGLDVSSNSQKTVVSLENEEKSRRFQVKIALEALGRNFEKVCKDHHVNILRCDTPVHYGGRGTHQLMTPYSTIYPPSFYAENSFSFHVDRHDLEKSNDFSQNTESPERERTHNEDNVGPRYTLFSNLHQEVVLKSDKPVPEFKIRFFNHNKLICCDNRRITVINTDIMACENFSLDHVTLSIDPEGNFKVNDSKINNAIQIADIWVRFDRKHLVVLMSDGTIGLFKVLDEERLKVPNNSILSLVKQFKLDSCLLDKYSRIIDPTNNSMLFMPSRRSIVKLGNLSSGEFIGKSYNLDYEFSQLVSVSDVAVEYLSLSDKEIRLVVLNLTTETSSLSSKVNLDSESESMKIESSLESHSFILSEFNPHSGNITSLTPFKVQNNQLLLMEPNSVKLPELSSILSLNSSQFICGKQDGTIKLLDTSFSDLIRHHFHPYPSCNASKVVSLIHDKQYGRLVSIHQHKSSPNEHLICMAKIGNNRFVPNLVTLFK